MRIELTVLRPAGPVDVAITAPGPTPLADVRAALQRLTGLPASGPLADASGRLPADAVLGRGRLRTGCVLGPVGTDGTDAEPLLELRLAGGAASTRTHALTRRAVTLGRAPDCDIALADDRASRRHALVQVDARGARLRDLGSTNGTSIDGTPVPIEGAPLAPGSLARIGDTLLGIGRPGGTGAALLVEDADTAGLQVLRAPRIDGVDAVAPVVELPEPPENPARNPVPWLTALLPAALGAGIAYVTDTPQFLLFALLSPVMLLSAAMGDRGTRRRTARAQRHRHAVAAAAAAVCIGRFVAAERIARRDALPDPVALLDIAVRRGVRLWERRGTDPDHLRVRLGSVDAPSFVRTRRGGEQRPAATVHSVPRPLDLRAGPLGLACPGGIGAGVARWLITQLAVLQSPQDVSIHLLLGDAGRTADWHWARWLPHLHRVDAGQEQCAAAAAALLRGLEHRRRITALGRAGPTDATRAGPHTVLVLDDATALAEITALAEVATAAGEVADGGLSVICVAEEVRGLPAWCTQLAVRTPESASRLTVTSAGPVGEPGTDGGPAPVVLDEVGVPWAERVARALAPLTDPSRGSQGLTERCALTDLLDPRTVRARWVADDGGADAVVGRTTDGVLQLDLVADGPHALVAGTTGSGKSQLLRTWVAALALTHPPDAMTFLLIDYKGGAAFAGCADLPHTCGLVTDLDEHQTRRALGSLHAELRRRERLFATVGAADLAAYRTVDPPVPLARLVIVVDEFAGLAQELPAFVAGLVDVAQRGRSLGVHLILATQRPGSAVTADIRANTSLRLALRVTDVAESTDVIAAPDAALIEPGTPGRAYLRTGTSLTCLQAASTDLPAADADEVRVELLGPWRRPLDADAAEQAPPDGLGALVAAVRAALPVGHVPVVSPWLPPLPEHLAADELPDADGDDTDGDRHGDGTPIGLVDLPEQQRQIPWQLHAGDTLLAVGRPGSGRTTLACTLARTAAQRHPPAQLEIYVVDARGTLAAALAGVPHLATAVVPESAQQTAALLAALVARPAAPGVRRLLLLDGWDAALTAMDDLHAARCRDLLTGLLRTARADRTTILVTGDRSLLVDRTLGTVSDRLLLALDDRSDYALAGLPAVVGRVPPGRGVRASDGALVQVAVSGTGDSRRTASSADPDAAAWQGSASAVRLRPLPTSVPLDGLPAGGTLVVLGRAGDDAGVCAVDLLGHRAHLLVAGPPRSGRTQTLCTVLSGASALTRTTPLREPTRSPARVIVAATRRSALSALAGELGVRVLQPHDTLDGPGSGLVDPGVPTLLLVDDSEDFLDTPVGDALVRLLRDPEASVAAVVAARADELAVTYRGVAAEVRRSRTGILLRPGPLDGELLGIRTERTSGMLPPGRGVLVGDPRWGPLFASGFPVPIQVAGPASGRSG